MIEQENTIRICMGSSCAVRGNGENLRLIRNWLEEQKIPADVQLSGVLCQGRCKDGPNIIINDRHYSGVRPAALEDLLQLALRR